MSLTEYRDVEQRSEQWYELRRGMVTASCVDRLITPRTLQPASNDEARGLTAQLVAERVAGFVDPTWQSNDMLRGVYEEPVAREKYAEHHAPVTECGFMVRNLGVGLLGLSPDGLVGDDGLVEIKSRRAKKHVQTVLADSVPPENIAQCQAALLVSGRKWLDYVSYSAGLAFWVKRVYPDPRWFAAISLALSTFESAAEAMVDAYLKATEGLPLTERLEMEIVI